MESSRKLIRRNDLVLVRQETTPPARWPLARVIDVHSGHDRLPRVVTLRTTTTTLKRPIAKLIVHQQQED